MEETDDPTQRIGSGLAITHFPFLRRKPQALLSHPCRWLIDWPMMRPRDWVARVNRPQTAFELESLRTRVQQGCPFGEETRGRWLAKR